MSKKVLLINGSARKKHTYTLLVQIAKILKTKGIDTEILNLFDYEINHCIGCERCITKPYCGISDDMGIIMKKIMDSDGVVFGSPVYIGNVTSKFKSFVDRTNTWVHKPEPAGKPVMFVATTASTGLKETGKFFSGFASGFGGRKGDYIYRTNKNMNEPVKENEMQIFLSLLSKDKKYYKPTMNEIIMFTVGKVLALKSDGDDRKFWEEKGWINMRYYYPCKMHIGKKIFSKFIFKVLTKAIA